MSPVEPVETYFAIVWAIGIAYEILNYLKRGYC